jgi:hypothetical protein
MKYRKSKIMVQELRKWERPQDYAGAYWYGWFIAPVDRTRDSGLLTESNWEAQNKILLPLADLVPEVEHPNEVTWPSVGIVREHHWAVGWVEWVAVHPSNTEAVQKAEELATRLDSYPVLDEDDFSRREYEAVRNYWEELSDEEAMEIALKYGNNPDVTLDTALETPGVWDYLVNVV